MSHIINIHRSVGDNLGDLLSAPYLYFPELGNLVDDIKTARDHKIVDVCVFGGGALLSGETKWGAFYNRTISKHKPKKIVIWGAGLNGNSAGSWVESIRPDMIYVRDYHNSLGLNYASDVSCMNKAFTKIPNTESNGKIICVSHPKRVFTDVSWAHKHVINKFSSLEEFIETVTPYEYVITSCYHPALWSTWLNKKVLVSIDISKSRKAKPSSVYKLTTMKHQPIVIKHNNELLDLETLLSSARSYPGSLQDSRQITMDVWKQVWKVIDS